MKKFANGLLILLLVTLAAPAAEAQWGLNNFFTLQADLLSTAHDKDCHFADDGSIRIAGLYLFDAVNPSYGAANEERPVDHIGSFRCTLRLTEGATLIGFHPAGGGANSGTMFEPNVYYAEPLPVAGSPVQLASLTIYFGGEVGFELPDAETVPCYLLKNVHAYVAPSASMTVSYTDADDPVEPYVAGECFGADVPDFNWTLQNPVPIAADAPTWDGLKALYR